MSEMRRSLREMRGPLVRGQQDTFAGKLARNMRETFMDAPLEYGAYDTGLSWPKAFVAIGKGMSFAYTSHKWEKEAVFNDYKHIAEGPQAVYAAPVLARQGLDRATDGTALDREPVDAVLPTQTAELTPLLFVEMQRFEGVGSDGLPFLPSSRRVGIKRIVLPGAMLYGGYARRPDAPENSTNRRDYAPFLFAASREHGVILLVTGKKLNVTRDGIVG